MIELKVREIAAECVVDPLHQWPRLLARNVIGVVARQRPALHANEVGPEREVAVLEMDIVQREQFSGCASARVIDVRIPSEHPELRHEAFLGQIGIECLHQSRHTFARDEIRVRDLGQAQRRLTVAAIRIGAAVRNH